MIRWTGLCSTKQELDAAEMMERLFAVRLALEARTYITLAQCSRLVYCLWSSNFSPCGLNLNMHDG
jgi:hypothetical protein